LHDRPLLPFAALAVVSLLTSVRCGSADDREAPSVRRDASDSAAFDPDAAACSIRASSFAQSCSVDTDCVAARVGDDCTAAPCARCRGWTNAAIQVGAMGAFAAAVKAVPPVPVPDGGWPACPCGTGSGGVGDEGSFAYCGHSACAAGLPAPSGSGSSSGS